MILFIHNIHKDVNSVNGFFLIRVAYVIACWGILLIPLMNSTSVLQMVASLMLYYLPLGLDYWTHVPVTADDKKRRTIGVIIPVILASVCFVLIIVSNQFNLSFLMEKWITMPIWIGSAFFVWLALRDFISYSDPEELKSRAETRSKQQERAFHFRVETEDRIKHYQKSALKKHVSQNARKRKRKRG